MWNIHTSDTVIFKDLTAEDRESILTFVKNRKSLKKKNGGLDRHGLQTILDYVKNNYLDKNTKNVEFIVTRSGMTKKLTQFAEIRQINSQGGIIGQVTFPIQARFLNATKRVASHPATNIFLDYKFWKNEKENQKSI